MKIHRLEVKNIASLKGLHNIDFDEISKNSHIYAITGKTGAGKSSILNSISLALYGNVYKQGSTGTDFVTLGENEAEISLHFTNNFSSYRAYWKLKVRKKNGELLKKPQLTRTLFQRHNDKEEALEILPQDVIKLSFNEFCKTTILNQGEFASFLTARFNERKLILEKFYEGDELLLMTDLLKSKIKREEEGISEFTNKIAGLSESIKDIKTTKDSVNELEIKHKLVEKENTQKQGLNYHIKQFTESLTSLYDSSGKINKYKSDLDDSTKKLNQIRSKTDSLQDEYNKLKEAFASRRPILKEAIKSETMLTSFTKELTHIETDLKNAQSSYENELAHSLKLSEKIVTLKEKRENLTSEMPQLTEYSYEYLSETKDQSVLDIQKINNYDKRIEELKIELEDLEVRGKAIKSDIAQQNELLQKISVNPDIIKINEEEIQKRQKLSLLLSDTLSNEKKSLESYSANKAQLDTFDDTKSKIQANTRKIENTISDIQVKIKELKTEEAISICISESEILNECIVCGNKHIDLNRSQTKNIIDSLTALYQSESEQRELFQKENSELAIIKTKIDHIKLALKENESNLQKGKELFTTEWNKFTTLPSLPDTLKESLGDYIDRDISQLKQETQSQQEKITEKKITEAKIVNLEQQLSETRLKFKKTQTDKVQIENERKDLHHKLDSIFTKLKVSTDLAHGLNSLIQLKDKSYELKNIDQDLRVNAESEEKSIELLAQYKERLSSLNKRLSFVSSEISQLKEFLKINCPEISPTLELEQREADIQKSHESLNNSQEEQKQTEVLIAEQKSKLDSLSELSKLQNQHLGEAKFNILQFEDNDSFLQMKQIKELKNKISQFSIDIDSPERELISELVQFSSELISESENRFRESQRYLTQEQTLLQQRNDALIQIEKYTELSKTKSSTLEKLNNLNHVIGRDEFRSYILRIIEELLVQQTNHELQTLCNQRYKLIPSKSKSNQSSEFQIQDFYHDGSIRKISTLSGGETFLVSLAMAMALAELTRGNTQIDSLFIDEGFGTLDADAIDEVYELLINIENTGRQIGIISHVKHLTERIPVNINLHKNQDGLSDIKIKFN